jgi:2-polyprenyl-6-methoxyphenol hydroxylase-like FAD-dependent oxidoreductase
MGEAYDALRRADEVGALDADDLDPRECAVRANRKPPPAALYGQAEIHRLRGEDAKAEEAYRAASTHRRRHRRRALVRRQCDTRATEYDARSIAACAYYSYFSGVPQADLAFFGREGCAFGGVPTNDGKHIVIVNWPAREFPSIKTDIEAHVWRALEKAPEFAARVRSGKREEKWYGTAGVPNYLMKPYGPGWALVGGAGYNRDPITAQGISDAFIDAERIADAIDTGLSGRGDLERALAATESDRKAPVSAAKNAFVSRSLPCRAAEVHRVEC